MLRFFQKRTPLVVFFVLVCILPFAVFGASSKKSLDYIAGFQDEASGGVKEEYVDSPQSLQTDWAIIAFAASGYDGKTVGQNKSLVDFALKDTCSLGVITDIERRIIALEATGIDAKKLTGCNLPQKIIDATGASGKIGPNLVSTVFGAIALRAADEPILNATSNFIISSQSADGGFNSGWGTESNFTSQAIMALVAAKADLKSETISKAKEYLKSLQTETGGIKYDQNAWSIESDAFSDSYALQAISSLGEDPNDPYWQKNGKTIIDDLNSLKNRDGSYNFNCSYGKMNPVWTTSIALIGLNGEYLPIQNKNLASWRTEPSPTPSPSVSPSSSLSPSATASQTSEAVINSSTVERKVSAPKTATVFGATNEPPRVAASETLSREKNQKGEVLGAKDENKKPIFDLRWITVIAPMAFITGGLVKFVELKVFK